MKREGNLLFPMGNLRQLEIIISGEMSASRKSAAFNWSNNT